MYDITSEDATHTWHEHLSILRQFADDFAAMDALADAITGGSTPPGPPPIDLRVQEMFAVRDTDGGIYLAGPGIWKNLSAEGWGAWERHLPPLAAPVNGAQRDWIKADCLSAGRNVWDAPTTSGIDGATYAASSILTSAERQAYYAAQGDTAASTDAEY